MYHSDARAAIELQLANNYSDFPIQYSGVAFNVPSSGVWVKLELLPNDSDRVSLGPNGRFRETGMIVMKIFTPANVGSNVGRAIADQLFPIFREATFSYQNSGTILCRVPGLDDLGVTADGNYYQLNLTVDYQRDVILA